MNTENFKSFIYNFGVDIVGIADMSKLVNMPVGLKINLFPTTDLDCDL